MTAKASTQVASLYNTRRPGVRTRRDRDASQIAHSHGTNQEPDIDMEGPLSALRPGPSG